MNPIESLESRTLLSATLSPALMTDLSNLTSDILAVKAQYQHYGPTLRADLQTLRADARAAGRPVEGLLMAQLSAASLKFFNITRADATVLFAKEGGAARVAFVDALLLSIHPNNARLQAKVVADAARLGGSTATIVSKLGTDGATLSAASAAALGAVSAAYPGNTAVANDVAKLQSDGSAFLTAISPSIQASQTDLAKFLSDVASGA